MSEVMRFVAAHDVGIGIVGTMVVIIGVISGYGRRHHRDTEATRRDSQNLR